MLDLHLFGITGVKTRIVVGSVNVKMAIDLDQRPRFPGRASVIWSSRAENGPGDPECGRR